MRRERETALRALESRLDHRFSDLALLDRALTHASRANEEPGPGRSDNEALEFLGDAVLELVVTDLIHRREPDGAEGPKTRHRARLVSAPSLAARAEVLGLPALLLLGRGEEKTGGRQKAALWADAYEAVTAALYLDGGFEAARRFLTGQFQADVEEESSGMDDPKSALQEWLQGQGRPVPEYVVAAEEGPDHSRRYRVECRVEDLVTEGEGTSKKSAEQQAAGRALDALREAAG